MILSKVARQFGIEPNSPAFQAGAMTASATAAILTLQRRIAFEGLFNEFKGITTQSYQSHG
jgi:hypothetical protein